MPRRPRLHPAALSHARKVARGQLHRREVLPRVTAPGVGVPATDGLAGIAAPRADTPERPYADVRGRRAPGAGDGGR